MTANSPRWTLADWFTGVETPAYRAEFEACVSALTALETEVAALGVGVDHVLDPWLATVARFEAWVSRVQHVSAFVSCSTATDSSNAILRAEGARVSVLRAQLESLTSSLGAKTAALDEAQFAGLIGHQQLAGCAHLLTDLRARAARRMSPAQEKLAGALGVDGLAAWGRLYAEISGDLSFVTDAGETVPLAWRRSLLQSPSRATRAQALAGSTEALAAHGHVFASTLNAIAGARLTLQAWRGGAGVIDEAAFGAQIERKTLDVMLETARANRELARRYLRLKARLLGVERLDFADLTAPLPLGESLVFSWDEAVALVLEAFYRYHPELGDFAREMFDRGFVEAEPRVGKRAGAFCSSSQIQRTSRVFMSFRGTAGDVRTLGHELGHAYHNHVLRGARGLASSYPMTLAETASIFAEALVSEALLARTDLDAGQRAQVLGSRLESAVTYLLNIPMRFEFERDFYRARAAGPLSAEALCDLMREAQRRVYGDALDPEAGDPWFWAWKLHFFLTHTLFYNFPYTFGYLFSLGVKAKAQAAGYDVFHPTYVELLKGTATAYAEPLALQTLGVDIREAAFWQSSIDGIAEALDQFEALI